MSISQVLGLFFILLTLPKILSIFFISLKRTFNFNFVVILITTLLNVGSLGLGHAGVA